MTGKLIDSMLIALEDVPDEYRKVYIQNSFPDSTALINLRILLSKRLGEHENMPIFYSCSNRAIMDEVNLYENSFYCINVRNEISYVKEIENLIGRNFEKIGKVGVYLHVNACEMIDRNRKIGILIFQSDDVSVYHKIQMAIPNMYPWLFEDNPLDEDEKRFISIIASGDTKKYIQCVSDFEKKFEIKERILRTKLDNYESFIKESAVRASENREADLKEEIDNLLGRLSRLYSDLNDAQAKTMGLKLMVEENPFGTARELIIKNPNLDLGESGYGSLTILVNGYLQYFDEDYASKNIENYNSILYYNVDSSRYDEVKKLLTTIFIDRKFKIRVCSAYKLEALNNRILGIAGYKYPETYSECLRNPHVDRYACLGEYQRMMVEQLAVGNYDSAILMMINSAESINFADSPVMQEFSAKFFGRKSKCIELPDGNVVNYIDAIKYMNKENDNG